MTKHLDAIGYLNDLVVEINEPWFEMACDLAITGNESNSYPLIIDTLVAIYKKRASYIKISSIGTAAVISTSIPSPDFLTSLSGFSNFKLLKNELEISFKKRLTLVFGSNGTGKSSICESLKVLASLEPSIRPLQNARFSVKSIPEFQYKFQSDTTLQKWVPTVGYGSRRSNIKYFDTAIAIKNVRNAVNPARVIVLTPFKLNIFESLKIQVTQLRTKFQKENERNSINLFEILSSIRIVFSKFKDKPLTVIDEKSVSILPSQIKIGENFTENELLTEKLTLIKELEKATSDEGLKLLRAEYYELETFLNSLEKLMHSASALWTIDAFQKSKLLVEKQTEQNILAKVLIPNTGTLDELIKLLNAATPLCDMNLPDGHNCPLCIRPLGAAEIELFKQYHNLLNGDLEKEILTLKVEIENATVLADVTANVDRKKWGNYTTLSADMLACTIEYADLIVESSDISKEPTIKAKNAHAKLAIEIIKWRGLLDTKKNALDAAAKGRNDLLNELKTLRLEIEPLEYAQAITSNIETLRIAQKRAELSKLWASKLPAFVPLLTKITNKAKEAYEKLVVGDFETRLNAEYKALTEKDMAAFGVTLARKGADAAVTVLPQIGGKDLEGVLSEGEQRVHALALFFAELETSDHSVLVFDDPISSFDYNYIANYCSRLRDFAHKYPQRQIIVLTHNWEFFVQLQTTLNQAGLDARLSVQILENCAVVADYSEKIDDLKNDINLVLNATVEPSRSQKEEIAGKMRRLIEVVVNTHVFNNQRHQYKQKSQAISAFQSFTKIVPLLLTEATILRDLYAKLSITEHDDPRNAYINTDKAMFQSRYTQIQSIEASVAARKP